LGSLRRDWSGMNSISTRANCVMVWQIYNQIQTNVKLISFLIPGCQALLLHLDFRAGGVQAPLLPPDCLCRLLGAQPNGAQHWEVSKLLSGQVPHVRIHCILICNAVVRATINLILPYTLFIIMLIFLNFLLFSGTTPSCTHSSRNTSARWARPPRRYLQLGPWPSCSPHLCFLCR
jgi:hypothetical protein